MDEMNVFAVIMAGGQGRRLWPLSRLGRPKQFLALTRSGRTLLQETVRRAREVVGSISNVLVVTQAQHAALAQEQLPELPPENLVAEPESKNTAACLALAAFILKQRQPQAVMIVLPVDHLFADEQPWLKAIQEAIHFAASGDYLTTIGIPPQSPDPNYGYIRLGGRLNEPTDYPVFEARQFIEKPAREKAEALLRSGDVLWNTGTFAWQVPVFLEAVRRFQPQVYKSLDSMRGTLSGKALRQVYLNFPDISVDYAILEKADRVAAVRGSFQRLDVGSLNALLEIWPQDASGNISLGQVLSKESRGNIVYTDQGLVGLLGVEDLVVIRSGEIVLVCRRERAAEVKRLVDELPANGWGQYL